MRFFYKRQFLFGLLLALFIVGTLFVFTAPTFAQNTTDTLGIAAVDEEVALGTSDLRVTVVRIINVFLSLLGIIALGIVLYGGFVWMTAGGNEEKVGQARKILINGTIGLVIIMSSWAITAFVLNKLAEATGTRTTIEDLCSDAAYAANHPGECGHGTSECSDSAFAEANPRICPNACIDNTQDFVVKSITPKTDDTNLHNVIGRVLFNHPIGDDFVNDPESVIGRMTVDGTVIDPADRDVVAAFPAQLDGNTVYYGIEIRPTSTDKTISPGTYIISVDPDVESHNGTEVTEESECGTFPLSATFTVPAEQTDGFIIDGNRPTVSVHMGGMTNDGSDYVAYGGEFYLLEISTYDTSGIGYIDISIEGDETSHYYAGPSVERGSDATPADPYEYTYRFDVPDPGPTIKVYDIVFYITDIDSNTREITRHVIVRPEFCVENPTDASCGGTEYDDCETDNDCSLGYRCLEPNESLCTSASGCVCRAWPYIKQVDYMSGAEGNWITIHGYHFGEGTTADSRVNFNFDNESPEAARASCENDVWHDDWIIVEVPSEATSVNQPSISVTNDDGFTDFSNDSDVGPDIGTFEYNETIRPGLCGVRVSVDNFELPNGVLLEDIRGNTESYPSVPVEATGRLFGTYVANTSLLKFGTFDAPLSAASWAANSIGSSVPYIEAGDVVVHVKTSDGVSSNGVPFTVLSDDDAFPPRITSIDPTTTTEGSYITITGENFGSSGEVNIGGQKSGELPDDCGDTWTDTQIIAKVPEGVSKNATVVVTRADNGLSNTGDWSVFVEKGPPLPSLCKLSPSSGSVTEEVTLMGENFSNNPTVLFWTYIAEEGGETGWLDAGGDDNQKIVTHIPVDNTNGYTMITGPIKVKSETGQFSNSMKYTVADCREPGAGDMTGFQCCTEGPEAGHWKDDDFLCEGGVREAGYVWRFTTGKIPEQFRVIESCDFAVGSPSPSPWVEWEQGRNVCLNAQIGLRFNQDVNPSTISDTVDPSAPGVYHAINDSNVRIYTCGTGDSIDCERDGTEITNEFEINVGTDAILFQENDGNHNLDANTWYRVAFTEDVTSQETVVELGGTTSRIIEEPLSRTRPCDTDELGEAVYCFEFKTGSADCELASAGIQKKEYTTDQLGVVQDKRYDRVFDFSRVWEPAFVMPMYYHVYGIADQECTLLNVDNDPWVWGPTNHVTNDATAEYYEATSSTPPSIGIATAYRHNLGTEIYANLVTTTEDGTGVTIEATSTLTIDLGNPRVIAKEPVCIEACINTQIVARFNQMMMTDTYVDGVSLHVCDDEQCQNPTLGPALEKEDDPDETMMRMNPATDLLPGRWYLVRVNDLVKGIGGISTDGVTPIVGNGAEPTEWKFRTKTSAEPCIVDRVDVSPDPFTSHFIGQKQDYVSIAKGAPDACSAEGQYLSSWDYGWDWNVADTDVAEVTSFPATLQTNRACTFGCLPTGSDVPRNIYSVDFPACGNGDVDPGEDCDIDAPGEVAGVSCTYNCLRPGNTNSTSTVMLLNDEPVNNNLCGDGFVSIADGEQCDTNDPDLVAKGIQDYCNDACRWTGSQKDNTNPDNINVPVCGSGGVTDGESCDIAITSQGCSDICLNTGTPLSQEWCDVASNASSAPEYCNVASSICGNGIVESDEECDEESEYCNDRCLLQDVCDTSLAQCVAGTEGCNSDCTYAGSSVLYENMSLCGNGIVETGEYPACETGGTGTVSTAYQGPVQVVTSRGLGNTPFESVSTTVSARATGMRNIDGIFEPIAGVEGTGDYTLMCGNTEYINPIDLTTHQEISSTKQLATANNDIFLWADDMGSTVDIDVLSNDSGDGAYIVGVGKIESVNWEGTKQLTQDEIEKLVTLDASNKKHIQVTLSDKYHGVFRFRYTVEDAYGNIENATVLVAIYDNDISTVGKTILQHDIVPLKPDELSVEVDVLRNDIGNDTIVTGISDILQSEDDIPALLPGSEVKFDNSTLNFSLNKEFSGAILLMYRVKDADGGNTMAFAGLNIIQSPKVEDNSSLIVTPGDVLYNDCAANTDNAYGVAYNSCCQMRPVRTDQYPAVNAGIDGASSAPVCRNTYLEVEFDNAEMSEQSFIDSVRIVQGHEGEYTCEQGTEDVTLAMNGMLGIEPIEEPGFWEGIWQNIKSFFAGLFSGEVFAVDANNPLNGVPITWCTSDIGITTNVVYEYDADNNVTASRAQMYIDKALDADAYIAVMLEGGEQGIHTVSGVGIKSPFGPQRSDVWVFKTGSAVCRIASIDVDPDSHVFKTPDESKEFSATAISNVGNQQIVAITDVYNWEWSWHPEHNPLFSISTTSTIADAAGSADVTTYTALGVEGHIDGILKAQITQDVFEEDNQLGETFTDLFGLTAAFCANPWPSDSTVIEVGGTNISTLNNKFVDNAFNFDTYYCADAQNPLSTVDDLPLFDTVIPFEDIVGGAGNAPLSDDTLQRYFLFSDTTDDVIGVQIFSNTPKIDGSRHTLEEWYSNKFDDLGDMQPTSIDGYSALTNGTTYYVNAYNVAKDDTHIQDIYNNIYQFTINENAGNAVRQVFEQFMNNLRFNINMTDHGYCLSEDVTVSTEGITHVVRRVANSIASGALHNIVDVGCTTDFSCRDTNGAALPGTNGYCSNERTKLNRDIVRLQNIGVMQRNVLTHMIDHQDSNNFAGDIDTSFIPGYTNSRWAVSWNRLASAVGGLATDPINEWRGCSDHDPLTCWKAQDSTFQCPAFASVYEYQYDDVDQSFEFFTQPEYIEISDNIVDQFLDKTRVQFARSCEGNALVTVNPSSCGDGLVNYASEACDPPGKEVANGLSCNFEGNGAGTGYQVQTCNSSCQWESDTVCKEYAVTPAPDAFVCGNNTLDEGEFCDTDDGVCQYKVEQDGSIIEPNIYILLDKSGSMDDVADRWEDAIAGIKNLFSEAYSQMNFGISVWPGTGLGNCGIPEEIAPLDSYDDSDLDSINNILDTILPRNGTPTAIALKHISDNIEKLSLLNDPYDDFRHKKLILITDGKASDSCDHDNNVNTDGDDEVIEQLQYLLTTQGVSTYVIGYQYTGTELDSYAQAGGTETAYSATDDTSLFSVVKGLLGCEEYSFNAVGSCSWDCNSYGGYCGDGYVQWGYEACDDGNTNDDDACKNNCQLREVVTSVCGNGFVEDGEQCDGGDGCTDSCTFVNTDPVCGDGEVNQESEQCDLGGANGDLCTPAYNESCTYCTGQCLIETYENPQRCGDGEIDYDSDGEPLEECDYVLDTQGNQSIVFSTSSPDGIGEVCSDKGSYQCVGNCQDLQDGCVNCGKDDFLTIPQVAVINPLLSKDNSPYNRDQNVTLVRLKPDLYRELGSRNIDWTKSSSDDSGEYIDPIDPFYFFYEGGEPDLEKGIETSPLCDYTEENRDGYRLFFNKYRVINDGGATVQSIENQGFGDAFDYPVNGEQGVMVNEVVMSPAVPDDTVRIVVRWKKKNSGPPISFVGSLYSHSFAWADHTAIRYSDFTTDTGTALCGTMAFTSGYWTPNCSNPDNLWFHPVIMDDLDTGTQGITIEAENKKNPGVDMDIAFVVQSLNGPINQYRDYELWVDVYEYHPNQVAEYSIYQPTKTYRFNEATQSSYGLARYWHVFNLERGGGDYSITNASADATESGIVLTKECQIWENLYSIPCPVEQ